MKAQKTILGILCVLILAGGWEVLSAKDDDFEFATSLAESGYIWLAKEELEKLKSSSSEREKVLRLRLLAKLFEQEGNLNKRNEYNTKFLKEAENNPDPMVQREVKLIKGRMWEQREEELRNYINDIQRLLHDINCSW